MENREEKKKKELFLEADSWRISSFFFVVRIICIFVQFIHLIF